MLKNLIECSIYIKILKNHKTLLIFKRHYRKQVQTFKIKNRFFNRRILWDVMWCRILINQKLTEYRLKIVKIGFYFWERILCNVFQYIYKYRSTRPACQDQKRTNTRTAVPGCSSHLRLMSESRRGRAS